VLTRYAFDQLRRSFAVGTGLQSLLVTVAKSTLLIDHIVNTSLAPSVYLGDELLIAYGSTQVKDCCRHFSCTREALSLCILKHSNLKNLKFFLKTLKPKKVFFKNGFPVLFASILHLQHSPRYHQYNSLHSGPVVCLYCAIMQTVTKCLNKNFFAVRCVNILTQE